MRLEAGGIYENSSVIGKLVGTMNFGVEKSSYAKRSCNCESGNIGDGKRNCNSDNNKRFYIDRSGNCEKSANGKKNFDSMRRLYVRGSYDYENSNSKKFRNSEKIS